ncbi:CRTAC1 family protein [Vibrio vulnificus]|uniref:CRTAC1 family protein n=1 Tax=Vibrio vulnificus TaxID=672 RepID=UPI001029D4ED|nr:CRTAC1 family protein [Vibrio vulnificus]EGQ7996766.1 VCBS repeat-containing protein [Vibrio vulnificus]
MKILLSNNAVLCLLFSCLVTGVLLPSGEVADIDSSPESAALKTLFPSQASGVQFLEQSLMWGVAFEHQSRIDTLSSIEDSYAAGGCVFDFNQDGFQDLLIVAGPGVTKRYGREHWWLNAQKTALYQNVSGVYFEDVSTQVLRDDVVGYGCASKDVNNDKVPDIAIGLKGGVRVFLSGPEGYQSYLLELASPNALTTSLLFDDINNDGQQDLLVSTLVDYQRDIKVGREEYLYHLGNEFTIEGFEASDNALFIGQSGQIDTPFSTVLPFGQFRTFSITPDMQERDNSNRRYLLANATGSASKIIDPLANLVASNQTEPYGRAAVQYSRLMIGNAAYWLVTGVENTGLQLFKFGAPRKNVAWEHGIQTNELSTLSGWGTLVADFDNNGLEDVVVAVGYHTPSINSKYRSQSGQNVLLLQQQNGLFSNQSYNLVPSLSRSSRGAAYADFNNDGFLDVVFFNNNGFTSLYINQGNSNPWISFDCRPERFCDGSSWQLTVDGRVYEQGYDKLQPYLSTTQQRVHFGLPGQTSEVELQVKLASGKVIRFSGLELGRVVQVDLESEEAVPHAPQQPPRLVTQTWESLFHQVMAAPSEQAVRALLRQSKPLRLDELSTFIAALHHTIRQRSSQSKSDVRLVITAHWILSHILQYDLSSLSNQSVEDLLDIIIHSEQKVFVDYLAPFFRQLDDQSFCHLTTRLSYWFEEEEILPNTKQLLYAPLLRAGTLGSRNKFVCAIEGVSFSEETTLGSTITSHIADDDPVIRAASLRALTRLKYVDAFLAVSQQCKTEDDAIVLLECDIYAATIRPALTLKPKGDGLAHKALINMYPKAVALPDETAANRLALAETTMLEHHVGSPISFHKRVALYFLLTSDRLVQRAPSTLRSLREQDVLEFTRLLYRVDPTATDTLLSALLDKGRISPHLSFPYLTNSALLSLLSDYQRKPYSMSFLLAMMKQCGERKGLSDACVWVWQDERLASHGLVGDRVREIYEVKTLGAVLMSNRLYAESLRHVGNQTLMEMMYWSGAYTRLDITALNGEWLDAFIEYSFINRLKLSSIWLQQIQQTKRKLEALPWTELLVNSYER